ncbi:hypothetical protein H4S07_000587 [Coemansia furcata]|uniref:Uncharacterized protein n=1 Tax=Coemansia furcata TaxID=417177 RepID=A0ACC1LR27_9FUNG|nr:hypothetical protein H4S07_000587 [Coemansia furcata]
MSPIRNREYVPPLVVTFGVLSVVRVVGALTSPIMDCDEVFNYWEPLHFVLHGWGKQTWEYAPQFALRSYAYVEQHRALLTLLGSLTRAQQFYAVRVTLALACAFCEAVFVGAVGRHVDGRTAKYTLLGLVGMAGMFHAAGALLPSSLAMCLGMLGSAAAMRAPGAGGRVKWAVCAFAAAAVWAWPYAAVVAVPFVVEEVCVRPRHLFASAAMGVGAVAAVAGVAAGVDSWYYSRWTLAAWNQIAYNVLGHGGSSALYGTEPWHFYVKNGLLNANVVMTLALIALPLCMALRRDVHGRRLLFCVLPFYAALGVFSMQPHKEERFLSIVYPHMCLNAAVSLTLLRPIHKQCPRLGYVVLGAAALVGALRMAALVQYYGAPIRAFQQLPSNASGTVCMSDDWYRFPSSFWLPPKCRLQFVAGAFDGHLPGDFAPVGGSSLRASTGMAREDFNSMNRWEPSHAIPRHVADAVCDYFVDVEYEGASRGTPWEKVACEPILDAERTPLLARVVYTPDRLLPKKWGQMCVYQKTGDVITPSNPDPK